MRTDIFVLIVEDNPDDFLLLDAALKSSEDGIFRILHAERLADGKRAIRHNTVDVAVLDLSLPDSWGLDTFHDFHDAFPAVPVVIITGSQNINAGFEAVKAGAQDYLLKGETSATAITRTLRYAIERQRLLIELKAANDQVKQLKGLLPICSFCKKVRDDKGYWNQIESYISKHAGIDFSHGLCPECVRKHYPDFAPK